MCGFYFIACLGLCLHYECVDPVLDSANLSIAHARKSFLSCQRSEGLCVEVPHFLLRGEVPGRGETQEFQATHH